MKPGLKVNVKREELASSLAAVLPNFIFWNSGKVLRATTVTGAHRVCVRWPGHKPLWFDACALKKSEVTVYTTTSKDG